MDAFLRTSSCLRVFVCVLCTSPFLRGCFLVRFIFFCVFSCPGDDDLKNDGETSEDQADDQTSMNLHDDHIDKTNID